MAQYINSQGAFAPFFMSKIMDKINMIMAHVDCVTYYK